MQGVRRHSVDHRLAMLLMGISVLLLGGAAVYWFQQPQTTAQAGTASPNFRYFALMEGGCRDLRIAGEESGGLCGHVLVHTLSTAGRSSFSMILSNNHALSFSGTADTQVAPDQYQLIVDNVTLVNEKKEARRLDARGQCLVDGNIGRQATVTCDAITDAPQANYHFSFTSSKPADVVYGQ